MILLNCFNIHAFNEQEFLVIAMLLRTAQGKNGSISVVAQLKDASFYDDLECGSNHIFILTVTI